MRAYNTVGVLRTRNNRDSVTSTLRHSYFLTGAVRDHAQQTPQQSVSIRPPPLRERLRV